MDRTTVQLYQPTYFIHDRKVQPGKAANLFPKGCSKRVTADSPLHTEKELFMAFVTS